MYAGIDFGGTNIAAGLCDETGNLIIKKSVPSNIPRPAEEIAEDMVKLVRDMASEANINMDEISSIGIGSPGYIDSEKGIVLAATNLRFENVPICDMVEKLSGKKTYIENDANVAAYAESLFGAAKGKKNSVMITLGTGVGGGIIVDNKVYSGHDFGAGEIGHMVIKAGGKKCTCGRKGCFEVYSSATGLINMTKEKAQNCPESALSKIAPEEIDGQTAFRMAEKGDKAAREVVEEYIFYLAAGIGNIIRVLYPDVVVIGGGISREGENLLAPLRKAVLDELVFSCNSEIVAAELGNSAGIIGAAMLEKSKR